MVSKVISAATLLLLAIPGPVAGRILLGPTTSREAVVAAARDAASEPQMFTRQLTLQAKTMRDLVERTAPISRDAVLKYPNWHEYLKASNMRNQLAGKTLEAVFARRTNVQRARIGIPDRMLVTAVEGFPAHPADLVDVSADGTILRKYQVKWGWWRTVKALQDPKYKGMGILTRRESFTRIEQELQFAEAKAARRSLALSEEWQVVRNAIDSGRLPGSWEGKKLPSGEVVEEYDRSLVKKTFAAGSKRTAPRATSRFGQVLRKSGKVFGTALIVVEVAGTAYFEYVDLSRYRSGKIGGGYLAFKSTLRASQLSLTAYAVCTPEPSSRLLAGVVVVVLVVVDVASDPVYQYVYQRRQDAAAKVLGSVKREERYHAARKQLLSASPNIP